MQMQKQYIAVPRPIVCNSVLKLGKVLVGILLMPGYMLAALILGAPGLAIHLNCAVLALRLFLFHRISVRTCGKLLCFPMDSTRYFEFHEVLKILERSTFHRYLDVSSPRILPLMLLIRNKTASADMINPDIRDIQETEQLVRALGLKERCHLLDVTIEKTRFPPETFDLITCISVLEHIPADREAVTMMWSLLRPGGRLVLTLPCMAKPLEQYISQNTYGVLTPDADGYTFWQRFYDEERLQSAIFSITGMPKKMSVYGEKTYGLFLKNAAMKRVLPLPCYPFWRESYMMATEYRYFKAIPELPGEGVIALEFVKP